MRLIDADELKRIGCESCGMTRKECQDTIGDLCFLREIADETPEVDAQPVFHAKWEQMKYPDCMIYYFKCSKCGKTGAARRFKYCPSCGAKMDGEK